MTFFKEVDLNDREAMVEFLRGHFRYHTLNSWNGLTSYANNVKLSHLGLPTEVRDSAYDIIFQGDFQEQVMSDYFDAFSHTHSGYTVGTNGRSGGYIVLYQGKGAKGIDERGENERGDSFSDWEDDDLRNRVKLVCDFDQMCDDLVSELINWASTYKVEEQTIMVPKKIQVLVEK